MTSAEAAFAHRAERVLRPSERDLYAAWRELVEANAEQIARLWEPQATGDLWGPGYGNIIVNPEIPSPHAQAVIPLARPGDTWLDIGAGFGSTGLPLARYVRRITAVDPSAGMTELLRANVERLGIENVDVLEPEQCPPAGRLGRHDVVLAALCVSETADIRAFLDEMERHASRLCVVLLAELGCGFTPPEPAFELLHGERYFRPPAVREFLAVMSARRRRFEMSTYQIVRAPENVDEGIAGWWRRTFLTAAGSEKERRLRELLLEHHGIGGDEIQVTGNTGGYVARITWEPPPA